MQGTDEIDGVNARLRWILAVALVSIVVGGTADLVMDRPATWLSFHVIFETYETFIFCSVITNTDLIGIYKLHDTGTLCIDQYT